VLVVLAEIGIGWLKQEEWNRKNLRFQAQAQRLQEEVQQQVTRAGDLLRSSQALFLDGREPDQARWDAFARDVELQARYPAIRSIQWVPRVPNAERAAFESRMRKIHGPSFRIWNLPGGRDGDLAVADEYFPISLVHPKFLGQGSVGFDVYCRATTRDQVVDVIMRQSALRIGNKVDLVEDPGITAFGLTCGIFDHSAEADAGYLERRGALRGLVTGMFDAKKFFGLISSAQAEPMAFAVYEGTGAQASALMFSNLPAQEANPARHERYSSLVAHGKTWTFHFQSTPAWESLQPRGSEGLARTMGLALSLTLGALAGVLAYSRHRALALAGERARELEQRNEELRLQSLESYAAERAREDLLLVVNHGLRTPLTALRGVLAVLAEDPGPSPETRRDLLVQAQKSSERALVLVNDLLDLHRLEHGKLAMDLAEINLNPALQEAIQSVEGFASAQNRPLRLECPENLRTVADPRRLQQVLNNLVGNALKHGQRGTAIRVWAESLASGRVRVSIHNLGESIPESVRIKLFGAPGSNATTGARLPGLGLPIAKGLIEAMGGTMGHVAVEGGNTFWFELGGRR
jgi:signal transduction histidine kinase